ncbi:MAG: 3-isopropylmalate dehydratase small subunit [Candidatus Diapherotrites archaeon CG08_land_8_20_14_0_20_34_12]|nr:MAG: 3-isopropylmalate dehydratase small subunit [Candidatus Diapherotrites archaeon CG08_land_8_20_14_0_20_34_12]
MNAFKIDEIKGRCMPLRGSNIDTDRILPARFLKEITFENMGKYLFYDERFDGIGNPKEHVFNDPVFSGSSILIVNSNFGCGSSREHAAHALKRFGIVAIIGESFSTIFASNCLSLGIPALKLSSFVIESIMKLIEDNPSTEFHISIPEKTIAFRGKKIIFDIPADVEKMLLTGNWNSTEMLLDNIGLIKITAANLPYANNFK